MSWRNTRIIAKALGLTATPKTRIEQSKITGCLSWWLLGCVEGDQPLPQTSLCRTLAEAEDAVIGWLQPEICALETEGKKMTEEENGYTPIEPAEAEAEVKVEAETPELTTVESVTSAAPEAPSIIETLDSTPDETNIVVKPAEAQPEPAETKKEGKKMQTKTILREAKLEGTARIDVTKIDGDQFASLTADGYIEKGPRGCLYVTPKAVVAWPDLFDFDASPSFAARMKAVGKNGDAKATKAPRKARKAREPKVVTKSEVTAAPKTRKPRAAKAAKVAKPAKAKRNGNAKVNSLMTRAEKAFKRFGAVYVKTLNELATRATKE